MLTDIALWGVGVFTTFLMLLMAGAFVALAVTIVLMMGEAS
jgi:hypothetical protein